MVTHDRPILALVGAGADAELDARDVSGATAAELIASCAVPGEDEDRDVALLRRVRAADTAALDALLQEYWCPLVAYVGRLLSSKDGAEDVVQEVFIRVWDGRVQLDTGCGVRPLLYRIARNLALNERRSERVRTRWLESAAREGAPRVPTPLHSSILAELEFAIERGLAGLPERRREAFVLARFHEMSHRQIASVMGVSVQTVANQISAALADLRRALAPYLAAERSSDR